MSRWIDASLEEREQSVYIVAEEKGIVEDAVEKDWWVTAILKVMFNFEF